MKQLVRRSGAMLGILMMVGAAGVPSLAFARHGEDDNAPSTGMTSQEEVEGPEPAARHQSSEQEVETEHQEVEVRREEVRPIEAQKRETRQTHLQDAKLRACQGHEKAIVSVMNRISDRGQKQADLFSTIANRAETFYVKQGKPLANYDELVADVASKKVAAQSTIDTIKERSGTFRCTGENPRGAIQGFKDALKSEVTALKNYRTSVKNLIVGIKSVQDTTTKEAK